MIEICQLMDCASSRGTSTMHDSYINYPNMPKLCREKLLFYGTRDLVVALYEHTSASNTT